MRCPRQAGTDHGHGLWLQRSRSYGSDHRFPRERMIAILTNNFIPCNGRFPLLISMAALFLGAGGLKYGTAAASLTVVSMVLWASV